MAIFFDTNLIHSPLIYHAKIFRISILSYVWRIFRKIVRIHIWNATSETFWPQLQFVAKNIGIWCTRKSEHWICHAFAKTIGKFIFVPPRPENCWHFCCYKMGQSTVQWMLVQYSYHFVFVIFADIGCVLSDSIFVHFYEDETTILNIQCGPSLSSVSIHTLFKR